VHDDGQIFSNEDHVAMGTTAAECIADGVAPPDDFLRLNEAGVTNIVGNDGLNVETVASNPHLSSDRKWAIRFKGSGTVTLVLGMRDYGRGWY
jgi:hypothetical protein